MNASRLLEIIQLIISLEKKFKIQDVLNNINASLTNLSNQPTEAAHQKELSTGLQRIRDAMNKASSAIQPAQVKLLSEIGAQQFFASDVAENISLWISENPATPAVARDNLATFLGERENYLTQARQLRDNLVKIEIETDDLEAGQAEIGFMLPRDLFENNLEQLLKELGVLNKIIRAFSEIATGSAQPVEVRQISTSDPLFFFGLSPEIIALIGASITWALHTWKQVEDIRRIRSDSRKISVLKDSDVDKLFQEKISELIENEIKLKSDEILNLSRADDTRKNELEKYVKWALESIMSRVERGMTVEIRLLPPPPPEAKEGEEPPPPPPVYNDLDNVAKQLVFPEMIGEPILKIPPPEPKSTQKT